MSDEAYQLFDRAVKMLDLSKLKAMNVAVRLLFAHAQRVEVETEEQREARIVASAERERERLLQFEAQQLGGGDQ